VAESLSGMITLVIADLWPLYGLTISTPRLELRLPHEEELAALARLAGNGVHRPDERPFLTPWTDGRPEDRARRILQEHWSQLGRWDVAAWQLGLGVFRQGEPVGAVTLGARDFPVVREVTTFSWLGLDHQGQGYGTEARAGLLTLAFDHLGARAARTEVFQDNHASQGVSRKLGYEHDGISVDARGGEAVISDRLRLTVDKWGQEKRLPVRVDGMVACRPMFGM
jgi:RimJ/RimL family protein N-acetyltransferase